MRAQDFRRGARPAAVPVLPRPAAAHALGRHRRRRPLRGVGPRPPACFGLGWDRYRARRRAPAPRAPAPGGRPPARATLLDGLEDEGRFDDAMIVVTADHGNAFVCRASPSGRSTEGNMEQIMWTPLLDQGAGRRPPPRSTTATSCPSTSLPTIAAGLGVEMPGRSTAARRRGRGRARSDDMKLFEYDENNRLRSRPTASRCSRSTTRARAFDARASRPTRSRAEGPDAVWRRTAHGGLFGLEVRGARRRRGSDGARSRSSGLLDDIEGSDRDEPLAEVVGPRSAPAGHRRGVRPQRHDRRRDRGRAAAG